MTSVLNRKFDVLCHSGACPPYLIDVLSLLVAHANDTELFKTEIRRSDRAECDGTPAGAVSPRAASSATPAIPPGEVGGDACERQLADWRTQILTKQVNDPGVLDDVLRASHETVLVAAERSLQTYAEDLKHINDIAMATSAKQLRAMRVETQQQMEAFRDRVCGSVVEQTKEELEMIRSELAASVRADVSDMVQQLHQVSLVAQRQLQEITSSYTDFVAQAHDVLTVAPLADAYEAVKTVEYMQEQVEYMGTTMAVKSDVETLEERLKDLEGIVATLGSSVWKRNASAVAAPPCHVPADASPRPLAQQNPSPATRSVSRGRSTPKSPSPPSLALRPHSGSAKDRLPSPSPVSSHPPARKTLTERLGVTVKAAADGVALTSVSPESPAATHRLGAGHIISHVGRTAVVTPAAFEEALRASEGQTVRITTFDPYKGRVRVLTVQPL
ncbi:hypothetical protein LSCM1_00039 [Leishmania martiniquensis]|uniref:PDZ domain-containing protein n=1 Tax=Leishmania martiniquensis TaxID=1580590 RepID=A0A836K8F5_9TRYP|nr:hypothetical protein LSCM1_00039 [Leishmania martiniquensis]